MTLCRFVEDFNQSEGERPILSLLTLTVRNCLRHPHCAPIEKSDEAMSWPERLEVRRLTQNGDLGTTSS